MKYVAKCYHTEEEIIRNGGLDPEYSAITGVEFDQNTGDIIYTIKTSKNTNFTVPNGNMARRIKLNK